MDLVNTIKERLLHYSWDIGFGIFNERLIENGLKKTDYVVVKNPYKSKWFADPFILEDTTTELVLLVEEFDKNIKRGRIARLTIDKKQKLIVECNIVLDLPTHLSFPAIYEIDGILYVNPENSQSGSNYIYRYDKEKNLFVERRQTINRPLADAIIFFHKNRYIMYATENPSPNGNILYIFESHNIMGPYHEVGKEVLSSNIARMAGHIICVKNGILRPAQDCNGAYGKAVLFVDNGKVVGCIRPQTIKYAGVHTFNKKGNVFVIDLKRYDYPYLYWLKEKIKK